MVSMASTSAAAAAIRVRLRASAKGAVQAPSSARLVSAPRSAERSSAPQVMPESRGLDPGRLWSAKTARAVSVAIGRMRVAPSGSPASAS